MQYRSLLVLCVVLASLLWAACSGTETLSPNETFSSEQTADASAAAPGPERPGSLQSVKAPTYYGHVKSLFEQHCNSCHKPGGLGPFSLMKFEQLLSFKGALRSSIVERRMPPWQAAEGCNEYSNDFSMSQDKVELLKRWFEQGMRKGNESDYQAPQAKASLELPRVDLEIKMPEPYTPPANKLDDYRCFVMDWPHKDLRFVTGFRVKPGNTETVHHLIIYLAGKKDAATYEAVDQKDPGPGYRCFGGPEGDAYPSLLGAWAPGTPATLYPKGTGLQVEPGSKLILQIHYNVTRKPVKPDQSVIELMVEKKVKQRAMISPFVDPVWLINKRTMHLPKGQSDVRFHYKTDLTNLTGGGTITLYGAAMHMHNLGKSGSMSVTKKDGTKKCLLNIPRWDFNWQSTFLLKKPVVLKRGDTMRMECRWDNSAQNQPVVNGVRRKPQDVYWGSGSYDEMCLSFLYITCKDPDGDPSDCFEF